MPPQEDALELLLPEADDLAVQRARAVTRFLRLLTDDASPGRRACSVGVDLERARTELERADRADLECALVDLLRHHLAAACGPDSFAWFGEPVHDLRGAWRVLAGFEAEHEWIAAVPAPDESSSAVAERLLSNLERIGLEPDRLALWRARSVHARSHIAGGHLAGSATACSTTAYSTTAYSATAYSATEYSATAGSPLADSAREGSGARAAERLYRAAWRALSPHAHGTAHARALLAGIVECLLERGHARDARTLLAEHQAVIGNDARLRQLLAWSKLVLGDAAGARAALVGMRPWSGAIPACLSELREARPDWLPCLAGRTCGTSSASDEALPDAARDPASGSPSAEREPSPLRDRHDVGASVLVVFVFRAGLGARALHADIAPGLRGNVQAWLRDREDAGFVGGSPEQRAIAQVCTIVEHAPTDGALRHALGAQATRATALAPVLDEEGEVAGWIHLEHEHHLVPGRARLAALARGWRRAVLLAREDRDVAPTAPARASPSFSPAAKEISGADRGPESAGGRDSPAARVFRALVDALGIKLHQRLWSGFSLESGEARLVASGGEGVGFDRDRPGRGRALLRSVATGGCVSFDEPDDRLSVHARAASGFVVPLQLEGQACGYLSIESSRRRDFKAKDVEACARTANEAALALRVAQLSAWHAARFRFEPWFDASREDFRGFAQALLVAARSRSTVVLHGPSGAGKLVLARWIHFESPDPDGAFKVHTCGSEQQDLLRTTRPESGVRALLDAASGGTLVLDDVDRLSPAWQEELLRALEGVERVAGPAPEPDLPARIVATTCDGLAAAKQKGRLRADLAARLDRLTLLVPALRERREEIPALVVAMASRFATEEQCAPPRFSDETQALLWRQPWDENLRGLENVVYKLVLLHGGDEVRPEHVSALRRRFGLELVRKLPSRHPDRRDMLAALRVTRLTGGRVNKTRAALYLGWDPDTLVARMATERIDEDQLSVLDAWHASAAEDLASAAEGQASAADARVGSVEPLAGSATSQADVPMTSAAAAEDGANPE